MQKQPLLPYIALIRFGATFTYLFSGAFGEAPRRVRQEHAKDAHGVVATLHLEGCGVIFVALLGLVE